MYLRNSGYVAFRPVCSVCLCCGTTSQKHVGVRGCGRAEASGCQTANDIPVAGYHDAGDVREWSRPCLQTHSSFVMTRSKRMATST